MIPITTGVPNAAMTISSKTVSVSSAFFFSQRTMPYTTKAVTRPRMKTTSAATSPDRPNTVVVTISL